MTLDVRGSLKSTKLSSNPYVVFEELISNAIESFLIRRHAEASAADMMIAVEVNFLRADLLDDLETMSVSCRDNGCGLGDDQLKAFLTKDTSYKDDLLIAGIGQCKGAGRIQFFHHFSALSIDSVYRSGKEVLRRKLSYSQPQKEINSDDFEVGPGAEDSIGTLILLEGFKEAVRERVTHGVALSSLFSAAVLKKQMLVAFLQRLVSLDNGLGNFQIKFVTRHWKDDDDQIEVLRRSDLPEVTADFVVRVEERDPFSGDFHDAFQHFKLSHYRLDAGLYDLPKNAIALCANSSPVKDITSRYLKTHAEQKRPVSGFHHIVLIESDFLDERVNDQRDDFDGIPKEIPDGDMFSEERIAYSSIYDAIDPVIDKMVAPASWNREEVLREVTEHFGLTEAMLQDTATRVQYGESARLVAERVLKKYQERVVGETEEILRLKEEILRVEPTSEEFRLKINDLAWKYTSSLKSIDMANLSQLVVRRAAIVEILDLACRKQLAVQTINGGGRRMDEQIIHSIFFPMRKDSIEVADHDIWLLSEEYHYYDYIASDVPLASIAWGDGLKVFDADIDEEFQKLLATRAEENRGKRPDIALFTKEGSAVIVEFKAPGVFMDEHIGDLQEYAHLLAAKSRGTLKRIYGYLIGDSVNPLRLSGNWTRFPTGNGYFQSSSLLDPYTRQTLGETYFEIMYFSDVIDRAQKRIDVYQNKLKLNLR